MTEKKVMKTANMPGIGRRVIRHEVLPRELPELKALTPETIKETITGIQKAIRENYVFAEQSDDLCRSLENHHAIGDYDQITAPKTLCEQLTQHLREVVNDKHLQVLLPKDLPPIGRRAAQKRARARILLLIGTGLLSRRIGILKSGDERVLSAYVYYFALPALYFFLATALKLSLLRIVLLPGVALLTTMLFRLPSVQRSTLVLMHGMPVAISMMVLSERYDFYTETIRSLILISSLGAGLYLNLWRLLLGY